MEYPDIIYRKDDGAEFKRNERNRYVLDWIGGSGHRIIGDKEFPIEWLTNEYFVHDKALLNQELINFNHKKQHHRSNGCGGDIEDESC